jgi:AcrR family transcriptional regulator
VPDTAVGGQGPPKKTVASRRRGEDLERAIYSAVIAQLEDVGYARLTMDRVAADARTGKAALYRRWPSKVELVVDTLDYALPAPEDTPDKGNVRDDLIEHMREKAEVLNSPVGRAVQSLLAEIDRDRPLVRMVQERVFQPRQDVFQLILERGVKRGEIRADRLTPLVAELGPAMLVQRFLSDSSPVPDDYLVAVVDELYMPIISR